MGRYPFLTVMALLITPAAPESVVDGLRGLSRRQHEQFYRQHAEDYLVRAKRNSNRERIHRDCAEEATRGSGPNSPTARKQTRLADYFARLKVKYQQAAQRPWLPVEPDPPIPSDD